MPSNQLRFAILCRVSTEQQADEGMSLEVQRNTLVKNVQLLNGIVVKEYIGQEHSTEGYERPILDEMMLDLSKRMFDAVMVYDLSRLTRDPIRSKIILAKLKEYGIKLFIQTQDYNFNNPETDLFIGIMSEINAYQVSIQNRKSQASKMELAKRGWSVGGLLPFGRLIKNKDKTQHAEWILDEEKFQLAQKIYDLYVNKRLIISKIVEQTGLSDDTIYDILKDKGFFRQTMNIDNQKLVFDTPLPPLFTDEQKAKIKHLLEVNRKNNGTIHQYLLSGFIRCDVCKKIFSGHTVKYPNGSHYLHQYYNHSRHYKDEEKCPHQQKRLKLKTIEDAVFESINDLFSNEGKLLETIKACNQNNDEQKQLVEEKLSMSSAQQQKLEKKRGKILKLLYAEAVNEDDVVDELKRIKKELEIINTEIISLQNKKETLNNLDVPAEILRKVQSVYHYIKGSYNNWSYETKRMIVEWFFGIDKNYGVFIGGNKGDEHYTIKSCLGILAFGWINDDCAAGVVGHQDFKVALNMPEFTSIINNIDQSEIFNPNQIMSRSWRV